MDIIQCNLLVKTKRKWKSRWVVLRRVSPASERINLYVYKDRLNAISKQKEKLFFPLREFCGMESIDKENKAPKLVVITVEQALSLRFEKKEDRDHWVDAIVTEGNFGEDVSFDGIVTSKQALKSGEVTLHIYPDFFTLVRKQNCRCIGRWHFQQLFNYGVVEGGFAFRIENENEKSSDPETFLVLTSFENQINRTFDTVYKTACNMYGSAEGLQRRPKLNSPGSEPTRRPRSMSEPSSFKRFMHRLSFRRRKSRRPKKPKSKTGSLTRPLDATPQLRNNAKSLSEEGNIQDIANASTGNLSRSASDGGYQVGRTPVGAASANASVDVRQNSKASCDERTGRQTNGNVCIEGETIRPSGSQEISTKREREVVRNGGAERGCDSGNKAAKTSMEMKESLSSHQAQIRTDGLVGSPDDLSVWQRRSALLPNTDDMIQQGFIKTKPMERCSADSSAGGAGSNNNPQRDEWEEEPTEAGMRQSRSSTIGSRRRMPNLTIEITPSGSDPSLNQYVNVAQPVKNKLIPKLKQGEWDRYDSEENVYHRVDAVVGPLGYENLPAVKSKSVTSLDTSYRNLPATYPNGGHSYENVSGAPDTGRMHYVNVDAKKRQNVNYIRVEGSGPSTPVLEPSYSPVSRKPNVYADYAEIDAEKTKQLRELAEQRVERVKYN